MKLLKKIKYLFHTHDFDKKWELNDGYRSSVGIECKECGKRQIISTTGNFLITDMSLWDHAMKKDLEMSKIMAYPFESKSDLQKELHAALYSCMRERVSAYLDRKEAVVISNEVDLEMMLEQELFNVSSHVLIDLRKEFCFEK